MSEQSIPRLQTLPVELRSAIAKYLEVEDFFNLCVSSKSFLGFLYDQDICKKLLQASPNPPDKGQPGSSTDCARTLRCLIKRRCAISSARPFGVAVIAQTKRWIYGGGAACYLREKRLRYLEVHRSADQEVVIDIPTLLDQAIPEPRNTLSYKFSPLHHADGIVSCLYKHTVPQVAYYLVVLRPGNREVITTYRLDSAHRIFVRNDADFLYYGTYSDIRGDGRRWVLRCFNIQKKVWVEGSLHLPDIVDTDIGSTICFEMIDGYFYVLTNQTSHEVVTIEYTSYYDFFRFPVGTLSHALIQRPRKRDLFRRQHSEGSLDERWTSMKIFKDELSGHIRILESRKEFPSNTATRTWYTKTFAFDDEHDDNEEDDGDQYTAGERLAPYLVETDNNGRPPDRNPSEVHRVEDSSISLTTPLSQCFVSSYFPLSQTSIDLVNDPIPSTIGSQRIRIRALSRQRPQPQQHQVWEETRASWPPDPSSPMLAYLHNVLNPPDYQGKVSGRCDDRSLAYLAGERLVLIYFSPDINFKGLKSFEAESSDTSGSAEVSANLQRLTTQVLDKQSGKGKHVNNTHEVVKHGSSVAASSASPWSCEPAMYLSIGLGFHFAKDFASTTVS